MAFRKEVCRNFQRGSCQYGERCKFLHVNNQQQQSNNNSFGFGSQQKQQNQSSSPFGFGTQSKSSTKPFENKWTRFSPISNAAATPSSRQPDNQPQPANHKCTDPDSCKRQIAEDFQNEKPLWKLTCYGHSKNGPCDIGGDVSYEELRALAYDEAKHGLTLQSIVERERNLLSSKLIEFENLLRNPYAAPPKSAFSQSPFPGVTPNAILPSGQNNPPPSVSSFSQLGASLNMATRTRPSTSSNNAFGQPNFSNSSQASSPFGTRSSVLSNNIFGQPNGFSNSSQTSSIFGKNNLTPANPVNSQLPGQASRDFFSSHTAGFSSSNVISNHSNPFPSSAMSTQITHSPGPQPLITSGALNSASNAAGQAAKQIQSVNDVQRGTIPVDASIWLKETWTRGEIPEEAPPDEYI
ncbi:zinc finger CCCH domain-containing protein 16 isoform X2 [Ricinus communis]|uniref:zinc finger CCCH domain-containing protein 16 isoform X2 n=1 Tax=Ricinus communis TaxID=3988 RepID=UPI0007725750|nr:zinc finger CCCH domain-containing protein 16 isoform X2 [Ricinus communis]|eukprot:XP_015571904.1 zinc finger CCCH domain-containing protein 16 isoform X2 [Ricinus communis]